MPLPELVGLEKMHPLLEEARPRASTGHGGRAYLFFAFAILFCSFLRRRSDNFSGTTVSSGMKRGDPRQRNCTLVAGGGWASSVVEMLHFLAKAVLLRSVDQQQSRCFLELIERLELCHKKEI